MPAANPWFSDGLPVTLPKLPFPRLSISAKLYAIFVLLATTTVALADVSVLTARYHDQLTDEFESAFHGAQNVDRVNGLIDQIFERLGP